MKRLTITLACLTTLTVYMMAATIVNGIPWYDQNGKPVSAHGANIIYDGGKYYMFGEFKTDSANVFTGFSCYSSDNLEKWYFESIAFSQQKDGRMGPNRVGERPKVLKCPKTGEYIMLMHTDNMQYKDPCTCYATSKNITGPYEFKGPILYKGQPVTKWDIGSYVDDDGRAYLLVHHGMIYRLAEDFHSLDSCLMNGVKGAGESPAMMKKDGIYYWMSSHTTSWERNDNMYWTATSLGGPWTYRGEFCPQGTLTWNSQCSFLLPLNDGRWMYMGDRWSFPRQHQAATYVWLPIEAKDGVLSIPQYMESWDVATGRPVSTPFETVAKGRTLTQPGETFEVKFEGTRIGLKGSTDENSGYAEVTIMDGKKVVFQTSVDFYSKVPAEGLRWISPVLPKGKYTLQVRCSEMKPNWTDKKRIIYGSKGYKVEISEVVVCQSPYTHYLFAYFTNNSTEGQQVCYAVSDNGLDFTPLNDGKPVLASDTISVSGGVRDPHILRGDDGWFRMVLTDMDWQKGKWSNRGIVMLRSRDLIHWQHNTVHFPTRYAGRDAEKADAVWAPQTIGPLQTSPKGEEKYMVYFSLHSPKDGPFPQDAVFYAYANDDFTDLLGDEPQRLFTFDGPTIDTDIVRDRQGKYHIFFNTWGGGGTGRRQFVAEDLHHPENWRLLPGLMQPEGMKMKSEGSSAYPLVTQNMEPETWVLAYDCCADGVFHFCTTTDMEHFTLARETKTTGTFTPRHGSIIPLTEAEYQQLIKHSKGE